MAVRRLDCILEDGTTPSPSLPVDPRKTLRVRKGETTTLRIYLWSRSGEPLRATGSVIFSVKRRTRDVGVVYQTAASLTEQAEVSLVIPASAFSGVDFGRHFYDIWLSRSPEGLDVVLPTSPLLLEPTVRPA